MILNDIFHIPIYPFIIVSFDYANDFRFDLFALHSLYFEFDIFRFSGISEKTLQNVTRTLRDVQAVLLSMFNSKTILIGHSLESDMKALKLIHDCVVDTSVLFPHKMGPPKKRALKTLCIENLKRIIQEDGSCPQSFHYANVQFGLIFSFDLFDFQTLDTIVLKTLKFALIL